MLLASASRNDSRHVVGLRFIRRSVWLASSAGVLVLVLSIFALKQWDVSVEAVISQTTNFLHRPVAGAIIQNATLTPTTPEGLTTTEHSSLSESSLLSQSSRPDIPADPLALPGWREGTKWVTNDPNVQMHHWLQQLIDGHGDGTNFDWARNKTVLLLGDSVLRGWVYHLCDDLVKGSKTRLTFSNDAEVDEKNGGWECIVPQTGTRFINGFVYGMTNYSRYPSDSPLISHDWPVGPWGIEDRIPALIEQYNSYDVDMVVLNSGAWDMKFMYRRDVYEGCRSDEIAHDELTELSERLRQCMTMVRDGWPSSKLAFLQTQPFDTDDVLNRWIWAHNLTSYGGHDWGVDFSDFVTESQSLEFLEKTLPPMFTRRRVSQLATTYRRIAAEEGWDSLDLWKIAEASEPGEFYPKTDPVHPAIPSIHVILDFVLEMLWRWETYGI